MPFLLIDKPKGMTSHDVVDRLRQITGEQRIGHAGTLDPNATGLLVVGIGRMSTKKLTEIAKNTHKTYEAEIVLGEERDTDDSQGMVVVKAKGVLSPTEREVRETLAGFVGEVEQIPPRYSAIKIGGRRAYELARKGKEVVLKPRIVRIRRIKLIRYKYPVLEIEAEVSAGTYIRALARDIGRRLGIGAYLWGLRRTKIGKHSVERSIPLTKLHEGNWRRYIVSEM